MKNKNIFFVAIVVLLIIFIFGIKEVPKNFGILNDKKEIFDVKKFSEVQIGENKIFLEFASTENERELGLSERNSLKSDSGLFFVFDYPDFYGIWMRNMKFPIDILWIDEKFCIVSISENIFPETFPKIFYPTKKSLYILETNANFVKKSGIKVGDVLSFSKK